MLKSKNLQLKHNIKTIPSSNNSERKRRFQLWKNPLKVRKQGYFLSNFAARSDTMETDLRANNRRMILSKRKPEITVSEKVRQEI